MGKATGFLESDREVNPSVPVNKRIKSFSEFHTQMDIKNAVSRQRDV